MRDEMRRHPAIAKIAKVKPRDAGRRGEIDNADDVAEGNF